MATSLASLQKQVNDLLTSVAALQAADKAFKDTDASLQGQVDQLAHEIDLINGTEDPPPPPPPPPPPGPTGFPDASNTGATGTLTNASGDITLSTDGQVYQNMHVNGTITIAAANVTVRNCAVNSPSGASYGIYSDRLGTVIDHCTVTAPGGAGGATTTCVWVETGSVGAIVSNCNISGGTNGIFLNDKNQQALGNYIHDLVPENVFGDPDAANAPHTDGIQMWGDNQCDGCVVKGNAVHSVVKWATSAMITASTKNLTIDGNYFDGGGYTVYVWSDPSNKYTNNVFGPNHFYASHDVSGPGGVVWTNNKNSDGSAVAL